MYRNYLSYINCDAHQNKKFCPPVFIIIPVQLFRSIVCTKALDIHLSCLGIMYVMLRNYSTMLTVNSMLFLQS